MEVMFHYGGTEWITTQSHLPEKGDTVVLVDIHQKEATYLVERRAFYVHESRSFGDQTYEALAHVWLTPVT